MMMNLEDDLYFFIAASYFLSGENQVVTSAEIPLCTHLEMFSCLRLEMPLLGSGVLCSLSGNDPEGKRTSLGESIL